MSVEKTRRIQRTASPPNVIIPGVELMAGGRSVVDGEHGPPDNSIFPSGAAVNQQLTAFPAIAHAALDKRLAGETCAANCTSGGGAPCRSG